MQTRDVLTQQASAKIAKQLDSVRQKKVQSLKNKINSGKYRISNDQLAKALFLAR